MKKKKTFEEKMKPFCLVRPKDEIGARKCGRECCGNCRTCVYHRPHRKDRLCVFRECPFLPTAFGFMIYARLALTVYDPFCDFPFCFDM